MDSDAHSTSIVTTPVETCVVFEASTVAELLTVPHVADVVGEVMCTEALSPEARSKPWPPQVSTPAAMLQVQPPVVDSTVQLRPGLAGRVSFITTSNAVPGPLLVTVTV